MPAHTVFNDVLTVHLRGDIDHHSAGGLSKETDELIVRYLPSTLVLDFGGVTFMDSSGIALVIGRYRTMKKYGGNTELDMLPQYVLRIFELAAVNKLIKVRDTGR